MIKRLEEINTRREKNGQFLTFVASYLNNCPTLVTEEIMDSITNGDKRCSERAFASFLANVFSENESEVREAEQDYLLRGVKKLDPRKYRENPYFVNIKVPTTTENNWEFGYQSYAPYEGFIYRDIECVGDYLEIPQIGFFEEKFTFPTVYENGQEWMAIKPNEIETMAEPIEKARGSVLVYGLGIGYFAYMVSQKDNVSSVTVVERDENVIALFEKHILPQFQNKHKIKVIKGDAFEYAEKEMKNGGVNYVFCDLWHDVSDGVDLYVKMKKYEALCPNCVFEYWIERSILSSVRWSVFDGIYAKAKRGEMSMSRGELETYLSESYLRQFVKFI